MMRSGGSTTIGGGPQAENSGSCAGTGATRYRPHMIRLHHLWWPRRGFAGNDGAPSLVQSGVVAGAAPMTAPLPLSLAESAAATVATYVEKERIAMETPI